MHRTVSRAATLLLTLLVSAAAFAAPVVSSPPTARLPRSFAEELEFASTAPDIVGLAVAVVRGGRIELLRTYGVRAAGGTDAVTPETVFRIASVSKGFAGVLAALEAKDGRLAFSDPVAIAVPQFKLLAPPNAAPVTIEDVLSHRTGLPPYAYDNLLEAGANPLDILGRYRSLKLSCRPHSCFGYQNTAFNTITAVIERATGGSYAGALQRRIFGPLGMRTASLGAAGLKATGNWALPHVRKGEGWRTIPVTEPYYRVPAAGGMNASILDLSTWLAAQLGARPDVLPPDVVAEVTRPRVNTPSEMQRSRHLKLPVAKTQYGLGWRIYDYAGRTLVTHAGGVDGYYAQIAYLPDRAAGIVVLSNTRSLRAVNVLPAWLDHELGLPRTDWLRLEEIAAAKGASL
jgi:beta-lactamase class C